MRLGVHLSYERNKRKLTRKELSELIQQHIAITVDPSTIENWEKEMTSVDVRVLPYLAALFGYSIEELVNPEVGPNEEEVLEMLGQDICDWCLVNSLDEFYQS